MTSNQVFWLVITQIIIPLFACIAVIYTLFTILVLYIMNSVNGANGEQSPANETRDRIQDVLRGH